jgi:hypothetical protein
MGSFTPHRGTHHFISVSERMTHPTHGHLPFTGTHNVPSLSQRGMTHPSHGNTQLMGFLTPHRGTQHSISVSERNNTPISWALSHPTHGLSHATESSQSLSAGGCLTGQVSVLIINGLVKISAIFSWVGRYCTCTSFLCTMSLI